MMPQFAAIVLCAICVVMLVARSEVYTFVYDWLVVPAESYSPASDCSKPCHMVNL